MVVLYFLLGFIDFSSVELRQDLMILLKTKPSSTTAVLLCALLLQVGVQVYCCMYC